jgi:hypothetical protein
VSFALGIAIGVGASVAVAYVATVFAVRAYDRLWRNWP